MANVSIALRNEFLDVLVLPHIGGGLARFDALTGGKRVALMRPLVSNSSTPDPNELACYPMVPWCNRIAGGEFEFGGRRHRVSRNRRNEIYPIHGDGWLAAWQVVEQTATSATLQFNQIAAKPFAYRSQLRYVLDDRALTISLAVENHGEETMPFGLGLHPWFVRTPNVEVFAAATGLWQSGEDKLPHSRRGLDGGVAKNPLLAATGKTIDNSFFGWNGEAEIYWPEHQLALQIDTEPRLTDFVFYAPLGKTFFCLEPVTHPINALNFPSPELSAGMINLAQGESTDISVRFAMVQK